MKKCCGGGVFVVEKCCGKSVVGKCVWGSVFVEVL